MNPLPHIVSLLMMLFSSIVTFAQTPFDAFSPETSRPILDGDSIAAWRAEQHPDTVFCAIAADLRNEQLLLVDITTSSILAYAPFTDEIKNWLSVDPLADKYIHQSPYLYCGGNPVMLIDLYGEEPVTPAPIGLIGTPEYYVFRQLDFEKRNPGKKHPYYIPYGYVNCSKFLSKKYEFTAAGRLWDEDVARDLQLRMEERLQSLGDQASQFEENIAEFNEFVYPSHTEAYINENGRMPIKYLGIFDLLEIITTPSLNHLIGNIEAIKSFNDIWVYLIYNSDNILLRLIPELPAATGDPYGIQ